MAKLTQAQMEARGQRAGLTAAEIAARIAASAAKRPPHEKIDNTVMLGASGLRIVHLLPERLAVGDRACRKDGMTVAYRPVVRNPTVLEISTAICRKGDVFSRKMGTRLAIENFDAGRTVFVPTVPNRGPVQTVFDLFNNGY